MDLGLICQASYPPCAQGLTPALLSLIWEGFLAQVERHFYVEGRPGQLQAMSGRWPQPQHSCLRGLVACICPHRSRRACMKDSSRP